MRKKRGSRRSKKRRTNRAMHPRKHPILRSRQRVGYRL